MTRSSRIFVFLASMLVVLPVRASDEKAARALLQESAQLRKKGDLAGALARANEADATAPSAVTGLAVAETEEALGRLGAATLAYKRVVALDLGPSASPAERRAQEVAARELADLGARVPTLKVDVQPFTVKDVRVTIDGEPAEPAVARYVDPGEHAIEVTAPGWQRETTKITLAERDKKTVTISLKKEDLAATFVASKTTIPDVPPAKPPGHTGRTIGYALLGAGGLGLAVGTFFGVRAASKNSDLSSHCADKYCDAEGLDLDRQAHSAARVSTIAFASGAGLAIIGGWLVLSPDTWELTGLRVRPSVSPSHAGVAAGASF